MVHLYALHEKHQDERLQLCRNSNPTKQLGEETYPPHNIIFGTLRHGGLVTFHCKPCGLAIVPLQFPPSLFIQSLSDLVWKVFIFNFQLSGIVHVDILLLVFYFIFLIATFCLSFPNPFSSRPRPEYSQGQSFSYGQYYPSYPNYYTQWGYDQYTGSYSYSMPQYGYTQSLMQSFEDLGEDALEDPDPKLDVDEANRELMEQGEEMYEALMNCHWQPLDYTTPEMFGVVSP
uniref:putative uncharacterized protein C6orf52 n=1 Tax=Myxine glutinosa TaxID=7769 RepID=UPI00358EB993